MPRITCPTCGAALEVTPDMIGAMVECGSCQAHFVALERKPQSRRTRPDEDRPSRRRREEENDRPSRRRREEFEEEDNDYLPRRRQGVRGGLTADGSIAGLGIASLILGIISVLIEIPSFGVSLFGVICCCAAPVAWLGHAVGGIFALVGLGLGVFGMQAPKGKGLAIAGTVMSAITLIGAIVGIVLTILGIVAIPLAAPANPQPNNPPPWNQPQPPPPPRFR